MSVTNFEAQYSFILYLEEEKDHHCRHFYYQFTMILVSFYFPQLIMSASFRTFIFLNL